MIAAFYPALRWDELRANLVAAQASGGYLKSLAAYGSNEDPRYAAIFLPTPPGRVVVQDLSEPIGVFNVNHRIAEAAAAKFFPEAITTTAEGPYYSHTLLFRRANPVGILQGHPIWNPPVMRVVPMRPWADFNGPGGDLIQGDNAYENLVSLDAFELDTETHVSAIFHTNPRTRAAWAPRLESYESDAWHTDDRYRAVQRSWARPEALIPLPKPSVPFFSGLLPLPTPLLTLWMGDTFDPWPDSMDQDAFTGGTFTRGPFFSNGSTSAAQLAMAAIESLSPDFWPIHVGANGPATSPILALTFARTGQTQPLTRSFHTVDLRQAPSTAKSFRSDRRPATHPLATHHARAMADEEPFATRANDVERFVAQAAGDEPLPEPPRLHDAAPTLAFGSPTPDAPKTLSPTPQVKRDPVDPFPPLIRSMMLANGARAAQLAIARNGKLVYSKAFTLAEPNYPSITPHHLIRVGSLGKPLTAMPIVAHYQTAEALEQPLTEALGIQLAVSGTNSLGQPVANPNTALMGLVRVGDTLRHRTGWGSTSNGTQSFDYGQIIDVVHNDPPQPGDVSTFLANTVDSVFSWTGFPRLTSAYNNWNFSVLGELAGKLLTDNLRRYDEAMRTYWTGLGTPPKGEGLPRLYRGSWATSFALGAAPAHLRQPGYAADTGSLEPSQYAGDDRVEGGAGNWEISASQVARILAGMDPGGPQLLLDAPQVRLLHAAYRYEATDPNSVRYDDGQGLGFMYDRLFYFFGGVKSTACIRLFHNGSVAGGASVGCHVFSEFGSVTPSVTVVLAMNEDIALGPGQLNAILSELQSYEIVEPWTGDDLFPLVHW